MLALNYLLWTHSGFGSGSGSVFICMRVYECVCVRISVAVRLSNNFISLVNLYVVRLTEREYVVKMLGFNWINITTQKHINVHWDSIYDVIYMYVYRHASLLSEQITITHTHTNTTIGNSIAYSTDLKLEIHRLFNICHKSLVRHWYAQRPTKTRTDTFPSNDSISFLCSANKT